MQLEHPLLLRCNERFTRHQLRQMPKTPNVSSVTDNRAPRAPRAPPHRPGRPTPPRLASPACPRRRRARVKNNCLRFISPLSLNRRGLELEPHKK